MNLTPECISCLFAQSLKVCRSLGIDDARTKEVLDMAGRQVAAFSYAQTPPQAAAELYPGIARIVGKQDPYAQAKKRADREAEGFVPFLRGRIEQSDEPVRDCFKAAVAGNVIDFGALHQFDLEEEVLRIFETRFAIDDSAAVQARLAVARRVMVVGDNVGEHRFDGLMLEYLGRNYPRAELFYAVRGKPIINDVTFKDAQNAGLDAFSTLVDSGVDTPGLDLARASRPFLDLYASCDLVIVKGMGNYESLFPGAWRPTLFLLKVKCGTVAASLGQAIGDIVCYLYEGEVHDASAGF